MTNTLFKPLLVILILTLAIKASMLFGRVQEQAGYELNTSAKSVLVDSAYAISATASEPITKSGSSDDKSSKIVNKESPTVENQATTSSYDSSAVKSESDTPLAQMYNSSEVQLLKELSKRRDELDAVMSDIKIKEKILKSSEDKINQKLAQLKASQDNLNELLRKYDDKEQMKIMSLVKIYEHMKPKEAAKIFDELDMSVLIKVVSNMKEIKAAPVIASMNPVKARDLSIELSKQKNLTN